MKDGKKGSRRVGRQGGVKSAKVVVKRAVGVSDAKVKSMDSRIPCKRSSGCLLTFHYLYC